jgi:hypothetical protein
MQVEDLQQTRAGQEHGIGPNDTLTLDAKFKLTR